MIPWMGIFSTGMGTGAREGEQTDTFFGADPSETDRYSGLMNKNSR